MHSVKGKVKPGPGSTNLLSDFLICQGGYYIIGQGFICGWGGGENGVCIHKFFYYYTVTRNVLCKHKWQAS